MAMPTTTDQSTPSQSPEEVLSILKKAAYFSIFSVPDPEQLSAGIPFVPFVPNLLYKIKIIESPRRHQILLPPPTLDCGFRVQMIGSAQRIAKQKLTLEMMPNNFEAGLGRTPPPTVLLPFLS